MFVANFGVATERKINLKSVLIKKKHKNWFHVSIVALKSWESNITLGS